MTKQEWETIKNNCTEFQFEMLKVLWEIRDILNKELE